MKLKTTLIAAAALALALPGQAMAAPKSKIKPATPSYVVKEDDGVATITLTRTKGLTASASVGYVTVDGTATAPGDYPQSSGRVTFPAVPGATGNTVQSVTFDVPIVDDGVQETTESFTVQLRQPSRNAVAVNPKIAITIADDDGATSRIEYALTNFRVSESLGSAEIAIVRSGPTASPSTVTYATSNGSADGSDYTPRTAEVTFGIGEVVKHFTVPVTDDNVPESTEETVGLSLSGISGAVYGAQQNSLLTIIDDDSAPAVQFSSDSVSSTVAESADAATLSVVRSGTLSGTVTVNYVTEALTAQAGSDYEGSPASPDNELTFGPGEYEQIVSIPVVEDTLDEVDEAFRVNLEQALYEGSTPAAGDAMTATVTIADNDEAPEPTPDPTLESTPESSTTTVTNVTNVTNTTTTVIDSRMVDEPGLTVLGSRLGGCKLTVGTFKSQRIMRLKLVRVKLHAIEACTGSLKAHVTGRKARKGERKGAVRTKVAKFNLEAGQTKTLKLRFTKKGYALLKRALGARKSLGAALLVRSVNPAQRVTLHTLRWRAKR